MEQTKTNEKGKWDLVPFLFAGAAVLAMWIITYFILKGFNGDLVEFGQFGDSYGALNTLYSGLAFAGIIATIFMQRKELKYQREELELTRKELTKSAQAQDLSQQALNLQLKLMTKQAVLTAYLSSYSNNLGLLTSGRGEPEERLRSKRENIELRKKINASLKEIEDENIKYK